MTRRLRIFGLLAATILGCSEPEPTFVGWPNEDEGLVLVFRQVGSDLLWQSVHVGRPLLRYDLAEGDVYAAFFRTSDLRLAYPSVDTRPDALASAEVVVRPESECVAELRDGQRVRTDIPDVGLFRLNQQTAMFEPTSRSTGEFEGLQFVLPISNESCTPNVEPKFVVTVPVVGDSSEISRDVILVDDSVYLLTQYGLHEVRDGALRMTLDLADHLPSTGVASQVLFIGEEGNTRRFIVLMVTETGGRLAFFEQSSSGWRNTGFALEGVPLNGIASSPRGELIALSDDGEAYIGTVTSTQFTRQDNLPNIEPRIAHYTGEDDLVIAGNSNVLFTQPGLAGGFERVEFYTEGGVLAGSDASSLIELGNDEWLVTTRSQGMFRFTRAQSRVLPADNTLPISTASCLIPDCTGETRFFSARDAVFVEATGRQVVVAVGGCPSLAAFDVDTDCRAEITLPDTTNRIVTDNEHIYFTINRDLYELPADAFAPR